MRRTHRAMQVRLNAEGVEEVVEVVEGVEGIQKSENLMFTLQQLELKRAEAIAKIEAEHIEQVTALGIKVDV